MSSEEKTLETPVLFLIFNRPEFTRKVFEAIRSARPRYLFIAADGPRPDRVGEAALCQATRDAASSVDWPCKVQTLFRDTNLGCKFAVTGAIAWFFNNVEEGIILEDDCIPDQSFFFFCEELLRYYRADTRIMMISGNHFHGDRRFGDASYYFTRLPQIWGWATWRRAWELFDLDMKHFPEFLARKSFNSIYPDKKEQKRFTEQLLRAYNGEVNTWDYQFCFCIWSQHGLCINPQINLVTNIGDVGPTTHTFEGESATWTHIPTGKMGRIFHPHLFVNEIEADLPLKKKGLYWPDPIRFLNKAAERIFARRR